MIAGAACGNEYVSEGRALDSRRLNPRFEPRRVVRLHRCLDFLPGWIICEDVGIEPEVLARSFMPPLADMQAAIADVQGDEEGVRECHEALSMLWEQRLELYGATVAVG